MQLRFKSSLLLQAGTTLLEVLVTIIILAFGLLGLAGLQAKIQLAEMESYQRAEALALLSDMVERMEGYDPTVSYPATGALGAGANDKMEECVEKGEVVERDRCEWSVALQGAAEKKAGANTGAMIEAHGCISQERAPDLTTCTPGVYRVTVTWQGMHPTKEPTYVCPGDEASAYLRSVSAQVLLGLPGC